MEIDLRKYWLPLLADVSKGLRAFQLARPNIEACTVGLFGDGFHGSASLHVDTLAHSAEFVRQWKHRHVFPFLKKLIAAVDPFPGLTRSTPFRVGVQMIDNQHEFWVLDTAAGHTPRG